MVGQRPAWLPPGAPLRFPNPRFADPDGLVAIGGDLSPPRLRLAYDSGIFPWHDEGLPPMWWSPHPRAVLDPQHVHVSRSLRRHLNRHAFTLRYDTAFETVMRECGRQREDGTWILPEMIEAYCALFEAGDAHSVEVWVDGSLVGGLYGVQRGGIFAAESMFHRQANASKVALVAAVRSLFDAGIILFDVQFITPHLASMGAYTIPRAEYLERAERARNLPVCLHDLRLHVETR